MLGKFSRREFAKLAVFSAVGMAAAPARSIGFQDKDDCGSINAL
jgi:hypothetical protein